MKDISVITLTVMNPVDSLNKIKGIVLSNVDFHDGNFTNNIGIEGNVILNYNAEYARLRLSKLNDCTDEELLAVKDSFLTKMLNEINTKSICVRTDLKDGFFKHEFFDSNVYNPPKKNCIIKLIEALS